MILVSSGFKRDILGRSSFADIFNGGEIRVFSGSRPSSANRAQGNNQVGRIYRVSATDSTLRFVMVDTYVIKPPSDEWRLLCTTPGNAGWWRLVAPGDSGGDSNTAPRIDGDIGTESAPAELTLSTRAFAANDTISIDSFLYTIPPLG